MDRILIAIILLLFISLTVKIQWLRCDEILRRNFGESNEISLIGNHRSEEVTDLERDAKALIESRGFICETHFVITEDGYNITLHRIVNPNFLNEKGSPSGKAVLLMHSLMGSGADFLINSEGGGVNDTRSDSVAGNNLGFELSYQGFDVWLGNSRGNAYARDHIFFKSTDPQFWQFSFDEMIKYDLPFTINYIIRITNSSSIGYVGHSQGSLLMFGLLSTRPEFSDIIKPFIALAPVSHVGNIKSPIKYIAHNRVLLEYFKWKGGPFLMNTDLLKKFSRYCPYHVIQELCQSVTFLFCGPDSRQFNATRFPVYVSHTPSGTSSLNLVHFSQMINNKKMTFYDYGSKGNKQKYGTKEVPVYPLEKITNKYIALISSKNDWLAPPKDVDILRKKLKVKLIDDHVIPDDHWNHLDFIWAIDTGKLVNGRVIKLLRDHI